MSGKLVVIAICTCRNPVGLEKLLFSLSGHETRHRFEVVVVDNDTAQAGVQVCRRFTSSLMLHVHTEERPGIPFARNKLISVSRRLEPDYVVMIDDDEYPLAGWLDELVAEAERSDADVVGGPVRPIFEAAVPEALRESDYTKGSVIIDGQVAVDSTANILLSRRLIDGWGQAFFNEDFAQSGGSDSELLRRTQRAGMRHAFASEAWVAEDTPQSRLRESWLLKRSFRNGNVLSRVTALHSGYLLALGKTAPRAAALYVRACLRAFSRDNPARRQFLARRDIARANGMLGGLFGNIFQEYDPKFYR